MLIRKLALCTAFAAGLTLPAIGSADIVGTGFCDEKGGCVAGQAAAEDTASGWDWLLQALDIVGTGAPESQSTETAPDIVGTGGE